jgi:hypothetical protein
MKWFQVDSDAPDDPKLRAVVRELGAEGIGGLFLLWCHIANHGAKPGRSIDSSGHPIPVEDLIEASHLERATFDRLVTLCAETHHIDPKAWEERQVISLPAMRRRLDTYTRRTLRTHVEQGSKNGRRVFGNKTVQDKTTQHKLQVERSERNSNARTRAIAMKRSG